MGANFGNIPGGEQLVEILKNFATEGLPNLQKTTVTSAAKEIKDSVQTSDQDTDVDGGIDASQPNLPSPDSSTLSFLYTNGETTAARIASTEVQVPASIEQINDPDLQKIANNHPMARVLLKFMSEEELTEKIADYFEGLGEIPPTAKSNSSYGSALKEALFENLYQDNKTVFPEQTTENMQFGIDALKSITDYASLVASIDPAPRSNNIQPRADKAIDVTESYIELGLAALEQLKNTPSVGDMSESDRLSAMEFLQIMAKHMQEFRQTIMEAYFKEHNRTGALARAQQETIDQRMRAFTDQMRKVAEKTRLSGIMKTFEKNMKIAMPIMQAFMIMVTLLLLPVAPAIILLTVMIQLAMLATTTALTETGEMEKMFDAFNSAISSIVSEVFGEENDTDLANLLMWLTILTVIVGIGLIGTFAPGIGAFVPVIVGSIVSTVVQQSGIMEYIREEMGIDNMVFEALAMAGVGMSFSLVTGVILSIANMIRQFGEEVFKGVINLVGMVVMIALSVVTGGASGIAALVANTFKGILTVLAAVLEKIADFLKILLTITKNASELTAGMVIGVLRGAMMILEQLFRGLQGFSNFILAQAEKLAELPLKTIKQILSVARDIIKEVMNMLREILTNVMTGVVEATRTTLSSIADVATKISSAGLQLKLANLTEVISKLDALQGVLRDLEEQLKSAIQTETTAGQQGPKEFMKQLENLKNLFEGIIQSYSGITANVTDALSG